jgi:hypothetical protein
MAVKYSSTGFRRVKIGWILWDHNDPRWLGGLQIFRNRPAAEKAANARRIGIKEVYTYIPKGKKNVED